MAHPTVANLTVDQFKDLVRQVVMQTLEEMLGDPDEELEIKKPVRERLLRQKHAVAKGERGEAFEDVVRRLKLG
jgi:hypothetical protein